MRFWILLALLPFLGGCAALQALLGEQPVREAGEAGARAFGCLLAGDTPGAVGQTIDMALILLGFKTAQKTAQVAKRKLVNPTPPDPVAEAKA